MSASRSSVLTNRILLYCIMLNQTENVAASVIVWAAMVFTLIDAVWSALNGD